MTTLLRRLLHRSTPELAAYTLITVAATALLAFVNKHTPLPSILFIVSWAIIFLLLAQTVARSLTESLSTKSLPAKIYTLFFAVLILASIYKVTSSGFSRHDEIYSWSMWATQHFLKLPHDLYYTQADYPQLFSYEIASIFLAQGSHIAHFFAKLIIAIPAIIIYSVLGHWIGTSHSNRTNWFNLFACLLAVSIFANQLTWAYADPLATAFLFTSLALVLVHSQTPQNWYLLTLAALCGLSASLTKQPGLIWCLLSLPLYVLHGIWRKGWPKVSLAPVLLLIPLTIIWPAFLSESFINNGGVLEILHENGGIFNAAALSIKRYIINSIDIAILLIAGIWVAMRSRTGSLLWILFVAPYLFIWFTIGAYESRHGLHVIFISLLLILHLSNTYPHSQKTHTKNSIQNQAQALLVSLALLVASIAVTHQKSFHNLQDGSQAVFISQFGPDTSIFQEIISNQTPIFTASNYQYGIFYARTSVFRPPHEDPASSTIEKAKNLLTQSNAEYTFTSGKWSYGPYSELIEKLIEKCPDSFSTALNSPRNPHLSIHKINTQKLKNCQI